MKHLKKLIFLSASIILIAISCSQPPINPEFSGNWVQSFQIGGWPRSAASAFVIGDTGYIALGFNQSNDSSLSDLWQFDPVKNNWTQKAFFPGGPRHSAVGFAVGKMGYVATGIDDYAKYYQDNWQYNPATNVWTKMASLPDNGGGAGSGARFDAVAFAIGNYGYVGTGNNGSWLKDFWKFDPSANTWTQITNLPGNKRSGAVAFTSYNDTTAYIVTGQNNGNELYDFWSYNPTSGWLRLRDIANTSSDVYDDDYTDIVRDHAVGFVMQDGGVWKAFIATGQNGSLTTKTWEYDFATDLWIRKTPYERSPRASAVSWSFVNLANPGQGGVGRAFVGTGKSSLLSLDDYDEFFPLQAYNPND